MNNLKYYLKKQPKDLIRQAFEKTKGVIAVIFTVFSVLSPIIQAGCNFGVVTYIIAVPCIILLTFLIEALKVVKNLKESSCFIKEKESYIEVCVGDLLQQKGEWFIPTNTAFAMYDQEKVSESKSIHAKFQYKYFNDRGKELEKLVKDNNSRRKIGRKGVVEGQAVDLYSYGTLARVEIGNKTAYMVASNEIGEEYRTGKNPIDTVLKRFWDNMSKKQYGPDRLCIPLVGTGRAGYGDVTKDVVAKKIVNSYINHLKFNQGIVTREMCIVVHPDDLKYVDIFQLRNYIKYRCDFYGIEDKGKDPHH